MSCGVYHLGFLIDTKRHTFCKGPSEEHSSYDFCQILKKRRNLPCGDDLLGFFFQLKLHRKPILIFFLISIEKPFVFNLNYIVKPLELNIKTIGFYLKLH
jgi:hypothetical protein